MAYKVTKKDVGKDIVTDNGYGEVMEVLSNGDIVVEYSNRKREVLTKRKRKELGLN